MAAVYGHEIVVDLLLKNGAEINEKDMDQRMALQLAAVYGQERVVQLLLEHGAKIHTRSDSKTALHIVAGHGHEKVVQLLLKHGADDKDKGSMYGAVFSAPSTGMRR